MKKFESVMLSPSLGMTWRVNFFTPSERRNYAGQRLPLRSRNSLTYDVTYNPDRNAAAAQKVVEKVGAFRALTD
ncbi:MAG: hypothetical protein ACRD11_05330 [Terriglobia bacterium]